MTSASLAAPIRQPRGPPSDSSSQTHAFALSPPTADADLRRANTFSTPRHQPSASVSSFPATNSAFHGHGSAGQANASRFKGVGRFRSGSLSSGDAAAGLVRKGSGREAVRTEEAVVEDEDYEQSEAVGMESESFAKGLSRQSSLPSRRFASPMAQKAPTESAKGSMGPPPRPPRRIQIGIPEAMSPPPPVSAHSASHSLSSLHMLSPSAQRGPLEEQVPQAMTSAGVSRTQSLRNQAKHSRNASLGRSSSLRDAAEHPRSGHQPSPSLQVHSYSSPNAPPASSTAALPPFQLGCSTSDIRRHQSLNNGQGQRRGREQNERTGALFSPGHTDEQDMRNHEPPLTSPIGPSMWSMQAGANGWNGLEQLSNTFDNLQINRRIGDMGTNNTGYQQPQQNRRGTPTGDLIPSMPMTAGPIGEPSWVAGLVGHDVVPRSAHTPHWQDQEQLHRQQGMLPFQHRWDQEQIPMGYMQQQIQHQQPHLPGPYNMPMKGMNPNINVGQYPGYGNQPMVGMSSNQGYMGAPMYPTPPASTHMLGPQDQAVIELARSKGLNPASFNCRPPVARFFVIKSYTEEDVQKSLKHEIWSSTVLGNKRLDTAFREFSKTGPIYLFFSVNGSRHFCGVAEMLTPVDESQNSTVWASDKWKGIFKVKWIFVRDVPSPALRHIRLLNTPEQKPMTNSRDTQELHYEAGCEVLQIFLDHQTKSKTSLLQDFAYYEQLSAQRGQSPAPDHKHMGPPAQAPTPPPMAQQYNTPAPMPMPMGPGGMVPPVPPIPARFR